MPSLSREQVTKIVHQFLINAPPGEFFQVVSDLKELIKDDKFFFSIAVSSFAEYNNSQYIKTDSPAGHKVLITPYGLMRSNEYLDPIGNLAFSFDHVKQQIVKSRTLSSGELSAEAEPYRKSIQAAALLYVSDHYEHGAQTTYSKVEGNETVVTTCISSAIFNHKNLWGGRWRSTWHFKFGQGSVVQLEGRIQIHVHYYEEGNVQLVTNTEKTATVPMPSGKSDLNALGSQIFKTVEDIESQFQIALDNSYRTMGTTTFKALRRNLPITQSKIDWDKIIEYRTTQSVLTGGR